MAGQPIPVFVCLHRCYIHLVARHHQSTWAELSCVSGARNSTALKNHRGKWLGMKSFVSAGIHSCILQMFRAKTCACHEVLLPGLRTQGNFLVLHVTVLYLMA